MKKVRGELVYKMKQLQHADFSVGFQVESNLQIPAMAQMYNPGYND